MLVWLYFVLGFFISALVHEMGHVGVGLLQGYREAVIRFGSSRDRLSARVRCGPIRIEFCVGAELTPHYVLPSSSADSAFHRLLRAAAGPATSALLYLLTAPDAIQGVLDLLRFSFLVNSLPSAVAFWSALGALVSLIPMRFHYAGINSDGLTIVRSLAQILSTGNRAT